MVMTARYNMWLVAFSILIAVLASYTALDLAGRVTVAQKLARKLWLIGGATAMGIGIWSMHFVAMLAYDLPMPMSYDILTVLVSLGIAILASAAALYIASRQHLSQSRFLIGGTFMGTAVAAMHYTGMVAIQIEATPHYDLRLVTLSIIIASAASLAALWLAFQLRGQSDHLGILRKLGAACLMGAGIAGMHYTAMAAVSFASTHQLTILSTRAIDNSRLAIAIGIATLIVLTLALLAAFTMKRIDVEIARAEAIRQSEERFHVLLQNVSDVIVTTSYQYLKD